MSTRVGSKIFVDRIVIEGFKSIRRVELALEPGINLLVGPNASGKTNILEAIYFLYRALVEELHRAPYMPHTPFYWSPVDLVYGRNPLNPILFTLDMTYYNVREGTKHSISFTVEFRVSPDQLTLLPSRIEIDYGRDTLIAVSHEGMEVKIREELFEAVKSALSAEESRRIQNEFRREENYLVYRQDLSSAGETHSMLRLLRIFLAPPVVSRFAIKSNNVVVSFADILPLTKLRIPIVFRLQRIASGETPKGFELRWITDMAFMWEIRELLSRIMLLKHPDIGSLREPKMLTSTERLDVRASNLAPVLLVLMSRYGTLPPRISEALTKLFPGMKIKFATQYGRVAIEVEEDGLELPPANVADGLFKLLAILTAIELEPSILLIDELENSMHAQLIEYVVDELNNLEIPVIVATHSPIVVDLVGPERTYVVEKKPGEGTVVTKIEQPEELAKKLDELGIAFSDYIFYKRTRVAG